MQTYKNKSEDINVKLFKSCDPIQKRVNSMQKNSKQPIYLPDQTLLIGRDLNKLSVATAGMPRIRGPLCQILDNSVEKKAKSNNRTPESLENNGKIKYFITPEILKIIRTKTGKVPPFII